MEKNRMSFEKALEGLERSAQALKSETTTLEEALNRFEEGMQYYETCREHLAAATRKIQKYDKLKQELTDYTE